MFAQNFCSARRSGGLRQTPKAARAPEPEREVFASLALSLSPTTEPSITSPARYARGGGGMIPPPLAPLAPTPDDALSRCQFPAPTAFSEAPLPISLWAANERGVIQVNLTHQVNTCRQIRLEFKKH